MTQISSLMASEAKETPAIIAEQLKQNAALYQEFVSLVQARDPTMVYMIGRGTSDHAGVFAKYLIEVELGLPVCSAAPSVSSVFQQTLRLDKALVIVISQSGRSPDILAQARMAKAAGALCVALVNDESSPLAALVDVFIPLRAGPELAVAATKSYLASLAALVSLVAYWKQDANLLAGLNGLPTQLQQVINAPARLDLNAIHGIRHCVVLGRAFGYAIALEMALKMKEVCGIQAEAFSSAEFIHGPVSLLNRGVELIDVTLADETLEVHKQSLADIQARGATVHSIGDAASDFVSRLQPLLVMQRFYLDIEQIARQMGFDPDNPKGLKKVTETL